MKRVLVVSDIHEHETKVNELIQLQEPDIILDCGDHENDFYKPKSLPWYFIGGNHEDDETIRRMENEELSIPNLFYIAPGNMVDVEGVPIVGMGGNFSEKSFSGERKKDPKPYHILPKDIEAMENIQHRDLVKILLMHESSKELWENTEFPFGQQICSEVVNLFPSLEYVISGHYHIANRKNINDVEHISLSTPFNYSHILFSFSEGKIELEEIINERDEVPFQEYMKEE